MKKLVPVKTFDIPAGLLLSKDFVNRALAALITITSVIIFKIGKMAPEEKVTKQKTLKGSSGLKIN